MWCTNLMANPRQENILFNIADSEASKQIVAISFDASRFESEHSEYVRCNYVYLKYFYQTL